MAAACVHPSTKDPQALLICLANYPWHLTIDNRLAGEGGRSSSYWDLKIYSRDEPTYISAGVALSLPQGTIGSKTSSDGNAGVYINGSTFGRNVVLYKLMSAPEWRLAIFYGTIGDINDSSLQPQARLKFVKNGSVDDELIQLLSKEGKDVDEIELELAGTKQKLRATASPPTPWEGIIDTTYTIEKVQS